MHSVDDLLLFSDITVTIIVIIIVIIVTITIIIIIILLLLLLLPLQAILQNDFDFLCMLLSNNLKFKLKQQASLVYDTQAIFDKSVDQHVLSSQSSSSIMMMMTRIQQQSSLSIDKDNKINNRINDIGSSSSSSSSVEINILSRYIDFIVQLNEGKNLHQYGFPVGLVLSWLLHNGHFGKFIIVINNNNTMIITIIIIMYASSSLSLSLLYI